MHAIRETWPDEDFTGPHWTSAFETLTDLWGLQTEGHMEATRLLQHLMKDRQNAPLQQPARWLRTNCRQSIEDIRGWRHQRDAARWEAEEAAAARQAALNAANAPPGSPWANYTPTSAQSSGAWGPQGGGWRWTSNSWGGNWWGGSGWDRGWAPHGSGPLHQGFR